jgi:hypothetical protein
MRFFHFAPMRLQPGSVIEPGNFGRIISSMQIAIQGNEGSLVAGYVARELMFELIRERQFENKPSRLKAVFGCPTRQDADAYAALNNPGGRQLLHEVETVDDNAPVHIGALSFCDITIGAVFMETTAHRAEQYWLGTPGEQAKGSEIIVESAIRIV